MAGGCPLGGRGAWQCHGRCFSGILPASPRRLPRPANLTFMGVSGAKKRGSWARCYRKLEGDTGLPRAGLLEDGGGRRSGAQQPAAMA
eukprot:3539186-Lingulodinium_polyedra.AAC.1